MWLTFAVLMGILVNPAAPAALLPTMEASSSVLPQAQTADKQVLAQKLSAAIQAGSAEQTRELLRSGADANGSDDIGQPLLIRPVRANNMVIVRVLLEAGANVNQPGSYSPSSPTYSPLTWAVIDYHDEMAQLLLSFGANVNGAGPGKSPLSMALSNSRLEMAKILIAAGADVKAEMAFAVSHHMPDIVTRLAKAQGLASPPRTAEPPMTAEQVVSFLRAPSEPMEWAESRSDSGGPTDADMIRVVSELRARLKAKPQDLQALLLWAHFALIPEPLQLPAEAQPPASEPESLPPPGVALDRVLAAQPHNAEALFLKGRITLASDPGKALVLLRQALEFATGNLRYSVFLAQILAEQGRPGEAAQVLHSAQKNHPALPFLEDLETLGVPAGGELVEGGIDAFTVGVLLSNVHLEDPWHLRMRFYHYLKSPAEIEAFYSSRIPGFRFIEQKEKDQGSPGSGDTRDRSYEQFVQVKSGSMKPVSKSGELRDFIGAKDGIYIVLLETNDDPDLKRKLLPGEHSCRLILTNLRK